MSTQYNEYLEQHIANVVKGYDWLSTNLPHLLVGASNIRKQLLDHDQSKYAPEEYSPYDEYFYGKETPEVVENFQRAWLRHIHHNPHHWQYWVLINDDPGEGEKLIEMPYNYVIEMICDWWAFSWKKGDLSEIFSWYDEHASYIKLAPETRKTVEDILWEIRDRLGFNTLAHHGIKGQKWGVKNGPPYPLTEVQKSGLKNANDTSTIVKDAIESGTVLTTINKEKQKRHTLSDHDIGRSYLNGDLEYAQALVDHLGGSGKPILDRKGNWTKRERVSADEDIGTYVDPTTQTEAKTNKAVIVYSKTGTHIYPAQERKKEE